MLLEVAGKPPPGYYGGSPATPVAKGWLLLLPLGPFNFFFFKKKLINILNQ
jgi:hypothetical protein